MFTPSQTGARRAPASESGRCRTTASALQALPLSSAGADLECAGPLRVLLGWVSREPVPSYPTLTCYQSSEGGEKPSALSSRGENLLDCLLLGGWKKEQLPRAGAFHISRPQAGCDSGEALSPSSQGVSSSPGSRVASVRSLVSLPGQLPLAGISPPDADTQRTGSLSGPPGLGRTGAAAPGTEPARRLPEPADTQRREARRAAGGRRGQRLSLVPQGHRPRSCAHPGLQL